MAMTQAPAHLMDWFLGRTSAPAATPAAASGGNPNAGCDESHHSDTDRGANQGGSYDSTCDGSPSENGRGEGNANGQPCAGCVGNADDKNPPGQLPNGSDRNAGYECDRNQGVGQGNPAHSGCTTTTTGKTTATTTGTVTTVTTSGTVTSTITETVTGTATQTVTGTKTIDTKTTDTKTTDTKKLSQVWLSR